MINSVPPRPPHGSADSASSPATGPQTPPRAGSRPDHSDLASRQHEQAGTDNSLAPRNRLGPAQRAPQQGPLSWLDSMLHPPVQHALTALERYGEALMRPYMATPPLQAFLPQPVATRAYQAPSVDGLQSVSFARMTPEDARAALLAMDLSPQFLEAMKTDLNHCTNPYSAGWSADSPRQFVATYGQLVAMPNGLDNATVAALYRMLASPEPTTPAVPARARATPPQQQTLPVMEMTLEDARAALQALEVAPQTLARMTEKLLGCVETAGSQVGKERAQDFRREYAHLLAMPPQLDATTLTRLVDLLLDLPEAQPQAEPHVAPQPDASAPQAPRLALHAMDPAEALQALLTLDVPEPRLLTLMHDLLQLNAALQDDDELAQDLAEDFAQNHGHLIELPAQLHRNALSALARMLMLMGTAPEED